MGVFSKKKNYNLELEKVLEDKCFSSNIKNLLFSMMYKIEDAYGDYKEVKRCIISKDEFLKEIVDTVNLYCDNIKLAEPDSEQAILLIKNKVEALTNENERSILTYPTEKALLYAISDITPKYFYVNPKNLLKNSIQSTLANGYKINNTEILRDFNGWSWDRVYEKNFNYIDNLIYQNLLIILGEEFLLEWKNYNFVNRKFLTEAKDFISIYTENDKYLKSLYKLIELKVKKGSKELFEKAFMKNQIEFLYFIEKKINKMNSRDELINILYELRYYKGIKISNKNVITDFEEIEEYLDKVMKFCVTKLCKIGAIKIISMDINFNYEIIKYALDTKIIELEKIKLYFEEDDKGLIIKVYDKDIFEKQGRKKIEEVKKMLAVKQDRKIKLFN